MEKGKETKFEVEFTVSSRKFYCELLEYLYEHLSFERAEEVSTEILEKALSLNRLYDRGSPEPKLISSDKKYRYLLFEPIKKKHVRSFIMLITKPNAFT